MNGDQLIRHIAHRVKEAPVSDRNRKARKSRVDLSLHDRLSLKIQKYSRTPEVLNDYLDALTILSERYWLGEVTKNEFKSQVDILIAKTKESKTLLALVDLKSIME